MLSELLSDSLRPNCFVSGPTRLKEVWVHILHLKRPQFKALASLSPLVSVIVLFILSIQTLTEAGIIHTFVDGMLLYPYIWPPSSWLKWYASACISPEISLDKPVGRSQHRCTHQHLPQFQGTAPQSTPQWLVSYEGWYTWNERLIDPVTQIK